jgi:hypothetical protein
MIGSRVMDEDHLDHLTVRIQATGIMHKEIVLILWVCPKEARQQVRATGSIEI